MADSAKGERSAQCFPERKSPEMIIEVTLHDARAADDDHTVTFR